ncbi:hypothetical protein FRB99_001818 [Tulasnella sp. 403]|nr:hypothetical protein FRB99_001818 [Tulasnella sp. 403]
MSAEPVFVFDCQAQNSSPILPAQRHKFKDLGAMYRITPAALSKQLSALTPARTSAATMASVSLSSQLLRKSLKTSPGRFSTFSSTSRHAALSGIPHPSTYTVKPKEETRTFSQPSRPRAVYERPKFKTRELPEVKTRWPFFVALGVGAVSLWAVFLTYTANQERLSSSVVRQAILKTKRSQNPELLESLGDGIDLEPVWWMGNVPWVNGQINMPKGQVDVSLRLKGSKAAGTLYFTSVRREKGQPFTILRYKLITDDGRTIHLDPHEVTDTGKAAK